MTGGSLPTARFSSQKTPHQPEVLQHEGHPLATWEMCIEIGRLVVYFLGSLLFLLGSIYFYPEYSVMWSGSAGVFASWCFVIGCIFFTGANLDFIQTIRYNHGTPLRQVLRAFVALTNYMASSIFNLGALYFLPSWYPKSPELGCWSFFFGSILFSVSAVAEFFFICMTHEDPRLTGFKIKNAFCWDAVAALATLVGAFLFVLGSWYYLPRYINLVDEGIRNMNKAVTLYVIGSIFFIISSLAISPGAHRSLKLTSERRNELGNKV
ncbi:putative YrhK domain-containing protein [Plasmopara halstedii]